MPDTTSVVPFETVVVPRYSWFAEISVVPAPENVIPPAPVMVRGILMRIPPLSIVPPFALTVTSTALTEPLGGKISPTAEAARKVVSPYHLNVPPSKLTVAEPPAV